MKKFWVIVVVLGILFGGIAMVSRGIRGDHGTMDATVTCDGKVMSQGDACKVGSVTYSYDEEVGKQHRPPSGRSWGWGIGGVVVTMVGVAAAYAVVRGWSDID